MTVRLLPIVTTTIATAKLFVVLNLFKPYSKAHSAAPYNQFHQILSLTSLFLAIFWFSDHLSLLSSSTLLPPSWDTQVCSTFSVLFFLFAPGTFLYLSLSPFLHSSASFILLLLVLHFSRHLSQSPWFFSSLNHCLLWFLSPSSPDSALLTLFLFPLPQGRCSGGCQPAGCGHRPVLRQRLVCWDPPLQPHQHGSESKDGNMEKPFILPHWKWS